MGRGAQRGKGQGETWELARREAHREGQAERERRDELPGVRQEANRERHRGEQGGGGVGRLGLGAG